MRKPKPEPFDWRPHEAYESYRDRMFLHFCKEAGRMVAEFFQRMRRDAFIAGYQAGKEEKK